MSTALYRRYRPETFAEVIGQEHVTLPLCAALTKDRVNHAYLFSGPRGCGKTTSARILARCLNCDQGPTPTPCGVCPSCRDLARGGPGSLDVVEIDAASHGGVDDARSLRERAAFAPARDRFKIFIIDEAHMVSTQGFNALLKIVEEPPPHVRFVFATTEPDKVIGTIRSRTHHYPFRLVPPERLQNYLGEICRAESVPVGQGVLPLVVRAGAGSVRDSLSVLDQLIAGADEEGLTYALAVVLLGYTDAALLDEVADGLAAVDGRAVFGVVERVIESGHDPRRFVEDLLERLRDLLVVAAVPDGGHGVLRGIPVDQFERMKGQAARFGRSELSRAADVVNAALTDMTGAISPRLQLELLVARLLLPGSEDTERGLRARVDRLEKRVGVVGSPSAPPPPSSSPASPSSSPASSSSPSASPPSAPPGDLPAGPERTAPSQSSPSSARLSSESLPSRPVASPPEPSASSGQSSPPSSSGSFSGPSSSGPGADVDTVRRLWPDVLDSLRGLRRMTWTLVSEYAQVHDLVDGRLLLTFDSPGRASSFGRGSHADYVRQALISVIGLDCLVEATGGGASRAASPSAPPTAPSRAVPVAPADAAPVAPAGVAGVAAAAGEPAPSAAAPAEPPGWEPEARRAAPAASSTAQRTSGTVRSDPSRSQGAGSRGSRSTPGRTAASASGRTASGRAAASARTVSGREDIPLPPEPPADEPPPEDDFDPYAQPPGPLSEQRPAAPGRFAALRAAASASSSGSASFPGSVSRSVSAGAGAGADPADDEPSADDVDLEDSGLVGPSVVAQLLGGRVIEERSE